MSTHFQHNHFGYLSHLMQLEAEAERAQLQQQFQRISAAEAERTGNSLIQLAIREEFAGMGGRWLMTLGKRNQQLPLPWTRLRMGSPVLLSEESGSKRKGWRGVVSNIQRNTIQVALSQWPEQINNNTTFRLDFASDELARQREMNALVLADQAEQDRLAELRDVLLGDLQPYFQPIEEIEPFNPLLNDSQCAAVAHALAADDVAIIHGPPGTGKTTAVVELVRQAVQRGERVLVCAPSNLGVDNVLERLLAAPELKLDFQVIRIGHPARVQQELREHTLEYMVENHDDLRLASEWSKQAQALHAKFSKPGRENIAPELKKQYRKEIKALQADAEKLIDRLAERLLDDARVICSTLGGLDPNLLYKQKFDLAVIDEAAQSTESACWIPLPYCDRLVLAGDHCQLPPTLHSNQAAAGGLAVSLMEWLMQKEADAALLSRQLTVQYRMHEQIMNFSSNQFYGGSLQAHPSVQAHLLCDLPGIQPTELTKTPVHFIDTAGAEYRERTEPSGDSRLNEAEATLLVSKVDALLAAGVAANQISVISPYTAQVRLLRDRLENLLEAGLKVGSIDGFQGRESEVVLISLVRSNTNREIGFLSDTRRMNVALTRARRKLIVIGDSATIGADPFYGRLLDYFEQIGAYHTVWEEMGEVSLICQ